MNKKVFRWSSIFLQSPVSFTSKLTLRMISQAIKIQLGSLEGGGGKVLGSEALVKAQDLVCSSVDLHFTTLIFFFFVLQSNWNEIVDSFDDMNLSESLLRGIYAYGFEKPSAIQQRAILPCIKGKTTLLWNKF